MLEHGVSFAAFGLYCSVSAWIQLRLEPIIQAALAVKMSREII